VEEHVPVSVGVVADLVSGDGDVIPIEEIALIVSHY
jgi:hypothetical protein